MDVNETDSPLSVTANIAGILTFIAAIVAAIYVRITYLRNSDQEYFRVKTSLSWYKTESTWLAELVKASAPPLSPVRISTSSSRRAFEESRDGEEGTECGDEHERHDEKDEIRDEHDRSPDWNHPWRQAQYEMYTFVMDDLIKLEQRLLELVEETEVKAAGGASGTKSWTLVPTSWGLTTAVALAWLPVRSKALELVRQRDALTARVSFTQMSMISSRIGDLEHRSKSREAIVGRTLKKLEAIIHQQSGEIHRLEDKIYRIMHRDRVVHSDDTQPEKPSQQRRS
ncbi:hypothetical protein Micbo1qcDRAFT_207059 [Microdochium bolleyi]|uniref:Uncharacterized protein n=1 Tax=Microdochium bolleyi TaxID=196109 RepID=A0A136IV55_9PEZI|nr:hypothetical protein Micbo1qcDRAFT_207059 [Microdochium bolleyi]